MNHYASKKQFHNIMYYAYSDIGRMISYDICKMFRAHLFFVRIDMAYIINNVRWC